MKSLSFNSIDDAQTIQNEIDLDLGYPKPPSGQIGYGIHINPLDGYTFHDGWVEKHATKDEWNLFLSSDAENTWSTIVSQLTIKINNNTATDKEKYFATLVPGDLPDDFYPTIDTF